MVVLHACTRFSFPASDPNTWPPDSEMSMPVMPWRVTSANGYWKVIGVAAPVVDPITVAAPAASFAVGSTVPVAFGLVYADGKPVANAAALAALVGGKTSGAVALELKDPAGPATNSRPAQSTGRIVTVPASPSTRSMVPSTMRRVASLTLTTHGMPSSRLTIMA